MGLVCHRGTLSLSIISVGHGSCSAPTKAEWRRRRTISNAASHYHISGSTHFALLQQISGKDSYIECSLVLALYQFQLVPSIDNGDCVARLDLQSLGLVVTSGSTHHRRRHTGQIFSAKQGWVLDEYELQMKKKQGEPT